MYYSLFRVQEFLAKLVVISFFAPHMSSPDSEGFENKDDDDKNKHKSNLVEKDDNENKDDDKTIRSPGH
jgi:hypothetical protein